MRRQRRCGIRTREYYSAVKKDEILPFAQRGWTQRASCSVKYVRQRKTNTEKVKYFTYRWNLKHDFYKTGTIFLKSASLVALHVDQVGSNAHLAQWGPHSRQLKSLPADPPEDPEELGTSHDCCPDLVSQGRPALALPSLPLPPLHSDSRWQRLQPSVRHLTCRQPLTPDKARGAGPVPQSHRHHLTEGSWLHLFRGMASPSVPIPQPSG